VPLAPVVAAALALGLPTRTKGLYIDGLDVLGRGGVTPYGVDIKSIKLTEQGPGQVSSLSFEIDDPTIAVALGLMRFVVLTDITRDVTLFSGFVRSYAAYPLGIGRLIEVECVGLESLLDWLIVPAVTIASGADIYEAVAAVTGLATGVGFPLRVAASSPTPGFPTTLSGPLAIGSLPTPIGYAVAFNGGSLRQAMAAIMDAYMTVWPPASGIVGYEVTVDMYGNLRVWLVASPYDMSSTDYGPLTISVAASRAPANLEHRTDMGAATRGVYVIGGNAAGSGLVSDGTGIPGPVALIRDASSLTGASRIAIAGGYLASHGATLGGSVACEDNVNVGSASSQIRPGSPVTITDVQTGLAAYLTMVAKIDKTFYPSGTEEWVIGYGSTESGSELLRRLTRDTLS